MYYDLELAPNPPWQPLKNGTLPNPGRLVETRAPNGQASIFCSSDALNRIQRDYCGLLCIAEWRYAKDLPTGPKEIRKQHGNA